MVKSKKILSVIAAAAIAITSVSAILGSTLAASETTWNATDPVGSAVAHYDFSAGSANLPATGAASWRSSDTSIATLSNQTDTGATMTFVKAGLVTTFTSTTHGGTDMRKRIIVDTNNIARYTLANSKAELKEANMTAQISMNLYGAKLSSTNVYTADTSKNLTMANEIKWTSRDTSVATVSNTGLITAATKEGSTFVDGTFTDCYGQPQVINYMVIIGSSAKVVIADPSGKYWIYTGTPNIYVECDQDGGIKAPSNFIYDTDNDPKTTGDRQTLTPITDAMKNTTPSAEIFDNTLPGYLTPTEKTAYEAAVQNGTTAGIVKGSDGVYYKKAPGTTNVWQAVQFNPTTGAVANIVPESYVGGTTTTPDTAAKLYKIVTATDVNPHETAQQATSFDNTYVGFLTGFDYTTPTGEYKKWLDALSAGTISSVSLNSTAFNMKFADDDGATLTATTSPASQASSCYWLITDNKDKNGNAMDAASKPVVLLSATTGSSIKLNTNTEGSCKITCIAGNKKATTTVNVRITNYINSEESGDTGANWIRIAQKGAYSLIVRSYVISLNYNTWSAKADIDNGTHTEAYKDSNIRDAINSWWTGNKINSANMVNMKTLAPTAPIRAAAVKSDAVTNDGYSISTTTGLSTPTNAFVGSGLDAAFPLSNAEAALYCSIWHYGVEDSETSGVASSQTAINNWKKVQGSHFGKAQIATFTRSTYKKQPYCVGNISENGGSNFGEHKSWTEGVRPAMWVLSSSFDWNMTVEEQL